MSGRRREMDVCAGEGTAYKFKSQGKWTGYQNTSEQRYNKERQVTEITKQVDRQRAWQYETHTTL